MLLEDYTYGAPPQTLLNVLEALRRTVPSPNKNDIIVSFLYVLMLETGFVPPDVTKGVEDSDFNYQRVLRLSAALPTDFKTSRSYCIRLILKSAPGAPCHITCVPISDDLLINCTIKNIANLSLLLDPLMYFTRSDVSLDRPNFQNLDHLGATFKNAIAFPAKVATVRVTGGVCGCLQQMPNELIVKILSYLEIQEVLTAIKTCRKVCGAAMNTAFWVKLLDRRYRRDNVLKSYGELKFIYEIKYAKELQNVLERGPH